MKIIVQPGCCWLSSLPGHTSSSPTACSPPGCPGSFQRSVLRFSVHNLSHCQGLFLPRCRSQHLSVLNFRVLPEHFYILSMYLNGSSVLSLINLSLTLLFAVGLMKMCSVALSRSQIKRTVSCQVHIYCH